MSHVLHLVPAPRYDHAAEARRNSQKAFAEMAESLGFGGWELRFDPMHLIHSETGRTIKLPKKATFRSALKALVSEA